MLADCIDELCDYHDPWEFPWRWNLHHSNSSFFLYHRRRGYFDADSIYSEFLSPNNADEMSKNVKMPQKNGAIRKTIVLLQNFCCLPQRKF